jgi:hypothetical protein
MRRPAESILSMRRFSLLLVALVSIPSAAAYAQVQQSGIPPAARVRVSAPALTQRAVIGRYDGLVADSLSLMPAGTGSLVRIPLSVIMRLELSDGFNRRSGAKRGAFLGFAGPVVWGFVCAATCKDGGLAAVGGILFGVLYGLPVGAAIGATILAPERWRTIPAPAEAGR